jgi:ZIP family zinc transporter
MTILIPVVLSLAAALATGLGGVLVALLRRFDMRTYDGLLGFAAGVMTAIATFGLLGEARAHGPIPVVLLGVVSGATALFALDRGLPHEHLQLTSDDGKSYRRGILLFAAMTLHNVPEGLAVGTSYAAEPRLGVLLAVAIALHNIPEGMAIAGPFRASGMPARRYLAWALGSGMAEPLAALIGAALVTFWAPLLTLCTAFAAGAMLYVVSDELIPESHSHGFEHEATLGFLLGFLLVLGMTEILR